MSDDMAVAEDRAQRFEDAHPPLTLELTDDEGKRVDVPTELLPRLLWWHVLLRPFVPPKTTKGGLYLPDQVSEANEFHVTCFQVLQIGPLAFTHPRLRGDPFGQLDEPGFAEGQVMPKVGDWVLLKKHCGARYKLLGAPLLIVNDDDIFGPVPSPTGWASYIT